MVVSTFFLKNIFYSFFKIKKYYFSFDFEIKITKKLFNNLLFFMKYSSFFNNNNICDIIAVDFLGKKNRFKIYYLISSYTYTTFFYITLNNNLIKSIPSISNIFKSASWLEREIWDLFGLNFNNNLDLRRILTDYGFEHNPLRKDFPLTGFTEIFYNDIKKKILFYKIELIQELRHFKNSGIWTKNNYE